MRAEGVMSELPVGGNPWFVPVGYWDAYDARRMIVEVQGHVKQMEGSSEVSEKMHKRYVAMRNALCF